MISDSISSTIDEVLSINPSVNIFASGDFNFHHKEWLTYSGGTDKPSELCYNISTGMWLFRVFFRIPVFWIFLPKNHFWNSCKNMEKIGGGKGGGGELNWGWGRRVIGLERGIYTSSITLVATVTNISYICFINWWHSWHRDLFCIDRTKERKFFTEITRC